MSNRQDSELDALLSASQPRPEPPEAVRLRVQQHVDSAWTARKRRQRRTLLAVAAGVFGAVAAGVLTLVTEPPPSSTIAISEHHQLWIDGRRHDAGNAQVQAQTRLTADRTTAFQLAGGAEVRLRGPDGNLVWEAPGQLRLEGGAVYIDSRGQKLTLATPYGEVSNLGTEFTVELDKMQLQVRVREGVVALGAPSGTSRAEAGQRLTANAQRVAIEPDNAADRWAWIYEAQPAYAAATVAELLEAAAAELQVTVRYASPEARVAASAAPVRGDTAGLAPNDAIELALGIANLEASGMQDVLVVRLSHTE